jgi:acetoin utilization deacetylase AcuC-like enzyme
VAIVDFDVHHGNGTQWMFYADPSVLYISSHQFPFYPGTGAADEAGTGDGAGYTVNIPLEAGATDADYHLVTNAITLPVLEEFAPELTILSAGYDAHEDDPLASMRLTTNGFAGLVSVLAGTAMRHGALAAVTEGGYDLAALGACLEASLLALTSDPAWPAPPGSAPRGERALAAVRAVHSSFWRL